MFVVERTLLFLCLYHLNFAKENYKRSFGTHFLATYPGLPYSYDGKTGFPKVIFYVFKNSDSKMVIVLESLRMQGVDPLRHLFTLAEPADVDSFSLPGQYITKSTNDKRGTFQLRSAHVFGVNMLIIVDMQSVALVHLTSTYSWDRKYIAFTLRQNPTIIIVNDHWQNKVTYTIKSESGQEIETARNIYHPGTIYKVKLEIFESYEIADCNEKPRFDSWTGTVLEGTEYFGVISGSCESSVRAVQCNNASITYDNDTSKDIAAEMLLPTVISGKEFITLNEPNRNAPGVLVLVAVEPETTVTHHTDYLNGTNLYSLMKQGDHITIDASKYASFLTSDKAIQVYYVMRSACKGQGPFEIGDASVTKLIPMQLFYHIYVLYTFTITSTSDTIDYSNDYIVLIVHHDHISHMVIDGQEVSEERHWYPVVGKPGWQIAHVDVLPGLHIVKARVSATYGCYTYGGSKGVGYLTTADHSTDKISEFCVHSVVTMTPGDYEDNDCDGRSDEEIPDALDNDDDGEVDEDLQVLVGFVTTMSTHFVFTIPGILLAHVNLESALQISMFTMEGATVIRLSTHHFGTLNITVLVTKHKPELISLGQLPTYDRGHKGTYSATGNSSFGLMVSASQTTYSLDIFTAIPVESWDKEYISVTVGQNPALVIVAYVAVSVTVRMRRDGSHRPISVPASNRVSVSGNTIIIQLGSLQSYEISECNSKDIVATLTGSVLTGSHPFGLVSGSCRSISRGYECEQEHFGESMDFTAEMLIPKSSFGKEYIVVSYNFPDYSGELVVVASVKDTSFQISRDNEGGADAYTLDDPGDWVKLDLTKVTGLLLSNKPILVMYYFRVRCPADKYRRGDHGDPSLGLLVPSALFFHEYAWNAFENIGDKVSHFALAIFAARYSRSFRLNSVKITMNNTHKVMGLPGWVTSSLMLPSPGVYTLESDIFAVFGLYVFGLHKQVTYLSFAGSIMSKVNTLCHRTDMLVCDDIDNDCDGKIDEELLWGKDDDLDHRTSEDICTNPKPKRQPPLPPDEIATNTTVSLLPEDHRFVNIKGRGTVPGGGEVRPTEFPAVQDTDFWSDWRCTRDCRDSNQHRLRTCLPTDSQTGNKDCDSFEEKRSSHCYVGVTCPSDCSKFTWGPGCKNSCSNCLEDCDPFYGNCTRCRPGYMFPINGCPDPCDAMTYGQDCEESCFKLCGGECLDHVTGGCPEIHSWYLYPLWLLILIPIALIIYLRGSYAKE